MLPRVVNMIATGTGIGVVVVVALTVVMRWHILNVCVLVIVADILTHYYFT